MPQAPNITVQLIHIQGPLRGEIQEFSAPEITIGRHPSCHLRFPKDLAIISRYHARIVREGNRHKLIDESTNGTFVNGKPMKEAYLKSGDVLTFAEKGGPKVSFLSEINPSESAPTPDPSPPRPADTPVPKQKKSPQREPVSSSKPTEPAPEPTMEADFVSGEEPGRERPPQPAEITIERVKVPLAIQYGPTLRAYKELPITIGRKPDCDFKLEHSAILDRHAQIFFSQDSYGVKDLTGKSMIQVNGRPIHIHALLSGGDHIQISPQGPQFRFLAGGRLAEIEESSTPEEDPEGPEPEEAPDSVQTDKKKSMFNKLFQR